MTRWGGSSRKKSATRSGRNRIISEVSTAPGGLPDRWVLKSFMVIGMALLALAALSRLTRCTTLLFGFPRPLDERSS